MTTRRKVGVTKFADQLGGVFEVAERQTLKRVFRAGAVLAGEAPGQLTEQSSLPTDQHTRRRCSPSVMALAIHAPVKSPATGRTESILVELFEYVRAYNMKFIEQRLNVIPNMTYIHPQNSLVRP